MLDNLKMATKIKLVLFIISLIAILIGIAGIYNINKIAQEDSFLYEKLTVPIGVLVDMAVDRQAMKVCLRDLLLVVSAKEVDGIVTTLMDLRKKMTANVVEYKKSVVDEEDLRLIAAWEKDLQQYYVDIDNMVTLIREDKIAEADAALKVIASGINIILTKDVNAIKDMNIRDAKRVSGNNTKTAKVAIYIMLVLIIAGTAFALVIGFTLTRNYQSSIRVFFEEMKKLIEAAIAGRLETRANVAIINFEFRPIAVGVNDTLDAVIKPLKVSANYIDRIAVGDIPDNITDEYQGDFNEIKNNLNLLIDSQNNLAKVAQGIADGDLNADIDVRSDNDKLSEAMIWMTVAIHAIISDVGLLADAAVAGELSVRADGASHKGDYKAVVEGLNKVMNAISEPLSETAIVLQAAAGRDLSLRVTGNYRGQIEELKNNVNITVDSLSDALSEVADTVGQVNSGAEQIADASQSLSHGATEQASSLKEITSSMAEIGSQTKINAENANQANMLSKAARSAAETGQGKMQELVEAMVNINDGSSQISKIIKVIDEIAFQTNLLALNAAVEAARAGRHGKGFAVVADEVRNLAGRSAKAAKETADLIESSKDKVNAGTSIVEITSDALQEIVTSIVKVTDIIGEIAASSSEQAQGIIQINQGLSQIDRVTQQNTANAEETAAAAEELSSQSLTLKKLTGEFKLS